MKVKQPINALALYLMALAAVIGCYSLYLRHAVPVIEGPPNLIQRPEFVSLAELPSPREEKSHLVPYLPTDSWELSDCKTLLTDSGTILFKEFDEQPDGSLKVIPFTLFSGLEQEPDADSLDFDSASTKTPTVLRCIDGAILKFDQPITDIYAGNGKAKLETARLTGNVDIYRPPSGPNVNDALHIMTSNVQVDKQRIYTLDNVQFVFGPNKASGRNLLIDLEHDESPMGADFSTISGVRRLELAFLHKLRIEPVGSNSMVLNDSSTMGQSGKSKIFSNQKSPIEVACEGPFVFDFDKNIATFEQNVVAQQMDRFQDSIKCEKLTLGFKEKAEPALLDDFDGQAIGQPETDAPTSTSLDQAQGDLELTTFLAHGSPAVVTSRSNSAEITGELLSYDVSTSEIVGRSNQQSDEFVTIISDTHQIVSKEIRYVIPEDNSLGAVNAIGPGRLIRPKTADQDEFFASWTKSLTTRNAPEQPGLQRIMLDGETSIRIADETQTNADQIEAFVWQFPISNRNSAAQSVTWDYQPFKILAQGNVSIVSPEFSGFSQKMMAIWPRRTAGAVQLGKPDSQADHRVGYRGTFQVLDPQRGNFSPIDPVPVRHNRAAGASDFIELTTYQSSTSSPQQTIARYDLGTNSQAKANPVVGANNAGPEKPIEFRGQEIEIRLQDVDKQTQIVDLTVLGDVRVRQHPSPSSAQQENRQPVVIKGEQLRMTPQGKDTYRAVVSAKSGKPASISAKEFELFGSDVNLDQEANKLWVEGAGSMKIYSDINENQSEKPLKRALNAGLKDTVPQNLDVAWKGGMIFDGAKIYFERNVVMSAIQNGKQKQDGSSNRSEMKSISEGLSVELTEPMNLARLSDNGKSDDSKTAAKIRELIFVSDIPKSKQAFPLDSDNSIADPVGGKTRTITVENRTFDRTGTLVEKQNIVVPNATFNVEGGGLYAKGPGTIATHRMGSVDSQRSNPFGRLSGSNNKKKEGLSFIQINFDGDLNIDPDQKEMIIDGNVRTVYAPVSSWKKTFNPDDSKKSAPPGSVNLRCDRLQIAQWASRSDDKPFNEMLASGNTHLFSETVEATASRVSYSQASDVLIVEGTPRTDANLWFKQAPNDKNPTHLIAEKISYRISDQWTQTQGVKNLNINSK